MDIELPEELKNNDPYTPTFNDKSKKFKYPKDPKKLRFAACNTCGTRIYHKQAIEVSKCNTCGYSKPTTEKKFVLLKKRCDQCGRKRKSQQYINEETKIIRILCNKCAGVKL